MRLLFVLVMFLFAGCVALKGEFIKEELTFEREPGNVLISCEGGKIQCLSEMDSSGQIFIKLKSLNRYTEIKFKNVGLKDDKLFVYILMIVDLQDTVGMIYFHFQPLYIEVNPILVDTTTLTGDVNFQFPTIQVLLDNCDSSNPSESYEGEAKRKKLAKENFLKLYQ